MKDVIKASRDTLRPSYYLMSLRGLNILNNLNTLIELRSLPSAKIEVHYNH